MLKRQPADVDFSDEKSFTYELVRLYINGFITVQYRTVLSGINYIWVKLRECWVNCSRKHRRVYFERLRTYYQLYFQELLPFGVSGSCDNGIEWKSAQMIMLCFYVRKHCFSLTNMVNVVYLRNLQNYQSEIPSETYSIGTSMMKL